MSDAILLDHQIQKGVRQLTLNRPTKRNALSADLLDALASALEHERGDRVILLRGTGTAFCAGLDLEEASNAVLAEHLAQKVSRVLHALYVVPAVTIAVVQGIAMAGGAGLMAACDLVVASEEATIGFPEIRRGLVAALVMNVLQRRVCGSAMNELLLLGEPVSAERAREIGLVHHVVPQAALESTATRLISQVMLGAPLAIARTKRLLASLESRSIGDSLAQALADHNEIRKGAEAEEGIEAFLKKRLPSWVIE